MKELITNLFGTYTAITYEVSGTNIIPSGVAGVDWTYIAGIVLFAICLLSLFKIIGTIIKR